MTDKVSAKSLQGKRLQFLFAGFFFLQTFSPAFTACGKKIVGFQRAAEMDG